MSIFNKKKETSSPCTCGGNCAVKQEQVSGNEKPRFIVLGACCKRSAEVFENTKTAVKELGFEDEVVNIGDMTLIAAYGVMSTPALVVDGKILSMGKNLKVDDVKRLIQSI